MALPILYHNARRFASRLLAPTLAAPSATENGSWAPRENRGSRRCLNDNREEKMCTGGCKDCLDGTSQSSLNGILSNNKAWAADKVRSAPDFFMRLKNIQEPEWLWIGCSDSRVPANELMGMGPGEVFVQRNVGNLATHKDMNCMSCMEYAVNALKVKHIIVCGHYNCGAVKAALTLPCKTQGLVNLWIQDIRDTRDRFIDALRKLKGQEQWNALVELNVMRQVFNVCTSPVVQQAWDNGQHLAVHGVVYSVEDGLLKELTQPINSLDDFERYAHERHLDGLRHLSMSVLEHMSFEREALRRVSMDRKPAVPAEEKAEAAAA